MNKEFEYKLIKPDKSLADFVEGFWLFQNHSDANKEAVVLPDGRIDLFFSQSATEPFHITLLGLEMQPKQATLPANMSIFAVSFRLLATEYILQNTISKLLNNATYLPADYWNFSASDRTLIYFAKRRHKKFNHFYQKRLITENKNFLTLFICQMEH